jgi:hypothetical protein
LGAVGAFRDFRELGGAVGGEPGILLRHAFDDVSFRVTLVHQLARLSADCNGVRSALIGDPGVGKRSQKGRIRVRVGLRRRGQADCRVEARTHYKQSHCVILVQIAALVLSGDY